MTNEQKALELSSMNKYDFTIEESNAAYNAAIEAMKWKEQQMIEKAVKWIKRQMIPYGTSPLAIFNYIEEFKKSMEE